MSHLSSKFTPHTIAIGVSSLALLTVSIAILALESRVQDAFTDDVLQYPGSSMAEFMFVPLNPPNIEVGSVVVKFAIASCSLFVSLLGIALLVLHWFRASGRATIVHIRILGSALCVAAVTNTATSIAFSVYLFVTEASQTLPRLFSQWSEHSFTQEEYVCKAVPSIFPDSKAVYGFAVCETSRAGRYLMLVVFCVSALLAALSVLQGHRDGVFAVFVKARTGGNPDAEQGRQMAHMPPELPLARSGNPQNVSPAKSQIRTSLYGFYGKP